MDEDEDAMLAEHEAIKAAEIAAVRPGALLLRVLEMLWVLAMACAAFFATPMLLALPFEDPSLWVTHGTLKGLAFLVVTVPLTLALPALMVTRPLIVLPWRWRRSSNPLTPSKSLWSAR